LKVLVLGKAKTGTTIVAKTIQANLGHARLVMEPKSAEELFRTCGRRSGNLVVKVIFEHWAQLPKSRNALAHNELIAFDRVVYTVRDPRDELVSRLIYFAFPWSRRHPGRTEEIEDWLDLIRQKEHNPASLSLMDLISRCETIFDTRFLPVMNLIRSYANFLDMRAETSLLVRYEDFLDGNLRRLEQHLGSSMLRTAKERPFRYTRRTASLNNWKSFLLAEDIEFIRGRYGEIIEKMGYTDWSLEPAPSLKPEHYSEYIENLLAMKFKPGWIRKPLRPKS
jgi:hypothetical protein